MNRYKKVVVKIGSSLITAGGKGLDRTAIADWAEQMAQLPHGDVDRGHARAVVRVVVGSHVAEKVVAA